MSHNRNDTGAVRGDEQDGKWSGIRMALFIAVFFGSVWIINSLVVILLIELLRSAGLWEGMPVSSPSWLPESLAASTPLGHHGAV